MKKGDCVLDIRFTRRLVSKEHRTRADAVDIQAAAWESEASAAVSAHYLPSYMRSTTSSTVRMFCMRGC